MKKNRNMNTFTSTGMNVPQVGQGQSVHIHHQNQRPKGAMMGAGIMKNNTTNSMTTNSMMPTANSYPSSQSLVGGLHQMAPVNQMHTTSVAPPTVPLSSQNGTMGAPQIQPPPTNKMSPSMDQKQSSEIHGKTTSLQQQIQTSQQQQTQSSEQQLVEQALNLANTKEKTPMCLINELARYNKISHQYTLVDEEGPAHKKIFYVLLKLGDTEEYKASGPSIKKAQHAAAAVALEKTAYTHPPPKPPKTVQNNWITEGANNQPITPTVELNALAMKRGEQTVYKPIEARHQQPYYPPPNYNFRGMYNQRYHYPRMPRVFYVSLKVGQREFIGEGQTRQDARHDGAKKALNILKKLPIPNNIDLKPEKPVETTENDADNLKSEISLVHEIALRRNMNVSFDVTRESGPPHMKTFVTVCKVGEMETGAEGNSKKISKKKAAELMLDRLKELPPLPPSIIKQRVKPTVNKKKNKNIIKQMQKADPNYGVGINPISRLIQIQQAQQKKEPIYTLVTERGLPRRREFVIQVQVDDQTCNGVGPNKKLAKRHAAEAMLTLLGYNKPSPQPAKPAIKSATTPEGQTGEKKVTFQENSEEAASDALNHGKTGRQLMPGLLLLPDSNYPGGGQQTMNDALGFCNVPTRGRPELHLRDISNQHNLDIKFDEFQNSSQKANKEFMSRVSLLTNPPRVFHGSGMSAEAARDMAALEALKFLEDLGKGDGPQVKVEGDLVNSTSLGGAHTGRVPTM